MLTTAERSVAGSRRRRAEAPRVGPTWLVGKSTSSASSPGVRPEISLARAGTPQGTHRAEF